MAFASPGPIASGVSNDFYNLIEKVVAQGTRQRLLEHFKSYFAGAAGMVSNWSSDEGWADTDLQRYMEQATENAPLSELGSGSDSGNNGDIIQALRRGSSESANQTGQKVVH
jgi:hypothetical protein